MALLIHAPLFVDGRDEIAEDLDRTLHAAEDRGRLLVDREQAGDGAAAFGDEDFLAGALDLIEEVEALGLELAGGDLVFHTMVILPWSEVGLADRQCGIGSGERAVAGGGVGAGLLQTRRR